MVEAFGLRALDLVRDACGFEQRYGYVAGVPDRTNHEVSVLLTAGDREVFVLVDAVGTYGYPNVIVRPPDPLERFGLHEAAAVLEPDLPMHGGHPAVSWSYEELALEVAVLAGVLHRHADAILVDHASTWTLVAARRRAAVGG